MGGLLKYFDGYDNQPITWIDDPVSIGDVQSALVFNSAAWKPWIAVLKTPFFHQDHPSQPSQAPQEPPPGHQHCGQEIPWIEVNIDVVLACMLPVDHAEFDLMQW